MSPRTIKLAALGVAALFFSIVYLWRNGEKILRHLRANAKRYVLCLGSIVLTAVVLEGALRLYLFKCHSDPLGIAIRYHALEAGGQGNDDHWYYRHIWRDKPLSDAKRKGPRWGPSREFYANFGVSLELDPLLGYRRKANVTFPGHETSNLGTRGTRHYETGGKKIVFYGDSFVESNAPSDNTLTAKMERKAGIDCLNYGVGGYGLDQIYLLFEKTYQQFDPLQVRFLIGVIGEDLQRMLLTVRQTPKPWFEVKNSALVLHTEHIDTAHPELFFEKYRPRFRVFLWELIVKGIRPMNDRLTARRERADDAKIKVLTSLIVRKFKESKANITFVIFSDWRNNILKEELIRQGIPYMDADRCVQDYAAGKKVEAALLFPGGHPSPELNEVIADFILGKLGITNVSQERV